MTKIPLKAISVNEAYYGRRFPSAKLSQFKKDLYRMLPGIHKIDVVAKLSISYEFGVSSKGSDVDNLIKAFQDVLSEKFGFNDNKVYEIHAIKIDVKKGQEYIGYEMKSIV